MAKTRSPQYPAIGLKEAVEKVRLVWAKDYQNKVPKRVVAEHMGFKGLNGGSLPILAALTKYGLLEGRGDETRVSDIALAIIAHETGAERMEALRKASAMPELFAELDQKFPGGKASDSALRSYLLTQKFIPTAADTVIRAYRETKQFVESESVGYSEAPKQEPNMQGAKLPTDGDLASYERGKKLFASPSAMLQEVFNLDEGPVTLTVPAEMSAQSYGDLEDYLKLFLRKAKRRATDEAGRKSDAVETMQQSLGLRNKDEAAN